MPVELPPDAPEELQQAVKDAHYAETDVKAGFDQYRASHAHTWRQRGPHLVCITGPAEHAYYIGTDKMLAGIGKQGEPILKSR